VSCVGVLGGGRTYIAVQVDDLIELHILSLCKNGRVKRQADKKRKVNCNRRHYEYINERSPPGLKNVIIERD
jgi:hypothetical protein